MKIYLIGVVWMICFISSTYVKADDEVYTGAKLMGDFEQCEIEADGYRCGRAAAYVKGYAKRFLQGRVGQTGKDKLCMPPSTRVAELMEVVTNFLYDNKSRKSELAFWLVQDAIRGHFACSK